MRMSTKRGLVALAVFLSVVVGLVVHTGTGTPSVLGWRDIAAICPVGALEVLAGAKAFLVHPIVLAVAVLILGFCVGKAFCAWVCPVPHIRAFFHPKKKRSDAERDVASACASGEGRSLESACEPKGSAMPAMQDEVKPLPPVGGKRDGSRFDSRHFVLLGTIASSFAFGFPVFCLICPVGLSFAVTIGIWNLFRFNEASWGLIVFPLVLLAEVVLFRKWCTTFCPISALLSLAASKSRVLRPVVERHSCLRTKGKQCTTCVQVCPERVDPHTLSIPECSRCGECVEKCPSGAIRISLIAKKSDLEEAAGAKSALEQGDLGKPNECSELQA